MQITNLKIAVVSIVLLILSAKPYASNWTLSNWSSGPGGEHCKFEIPLATFISEENFFAELNPICRRGLSLNLSGEITLDDSDKLARLEAYLEKNALAPKPTSLSVDSPGGSVSVAMEIANAMRNPSSPVFGMGVIVPSPAKCYSSCVLLLAAGMQRSAAGEIGIHRPRFVAGEYQKMGYNDLQSAYEGVYDKLSGFFRKTNIHESLVQDMWNTPSDELHILSALELSQYRLNQTDLVVEERGILKITDACGEDGLKNMNAFHKILDSKCRNPRNNQLNFDCYSEELKKHPYLDCYQKLGSQ